MNEPFNISGYNPFMYPCASTGVHIMYFYDSLTAGTGVRSALGLGRLESGESLRITPAAAPPG